MAATAVDDNTVWGTVGRVPKVSTTDASTAIHDTRYFPCRVRQVESPISSTGSELSGE